MVGITVTASIVLVLKPVNKEYISEHQISVDKKREMFSEMGVVTKTQYFKYYLHQFVTYPFASVYSSIKLFNKLDSKKYEEYKKINFETKVADQKTKKEWRKSITSLKKQYRELILKNRKENNKYNFEIRKYKTSNKEELFAMKKELKNKIHDLKLNSTKIKITQKKKEMSVVLRERLDLRKAKITSLNSEMKTIKKAHKKGSIRNKMIEKIKLEIEKYKSNDKKEIFGILEETKKQIRVLNLNYPKMNTVIQRHQLFSKFYKKHDLRESRVATLKSELYRNIQTIKSHQEAELIKIKEQIINCKNNFKRLSESEDAEKRALANNDYKLIKRLEAEIKTTKKTQKKDSIIKDTIKKTKLEIKFINQPQHSNILDNLEERKLTTEERENDLKINYLKLYQYDKTHNISFYKIRKSIWFLSYAGFLLSFGTIMLSVLFWILSGLAVPPIQSDVIVLTSVIYLGLTPFILIANRTLLYDALDNDQKLITLNRKLFWYGIVGLITFNIPGFYNGVVNSRRIKKIQRYVATT